MITLLILLTATVCVSGCKIVENKEEPTFMTFMNKTESVWYCGDSTNVCGKYVTLYFKVLDDSDITSANRTECVREMQCTEDCYDAIVAPLKIGQKYLIFWWHWDWDIYLKKEWCYHVRYDLGYSASNNTLPYYTLILLALIYLLSL